MISIDRIAYIGTVADISSSADEFTAESTSFPDYTSISISIDHYRENFENLVQAISEYQDLLKADAQSLKEAGAELAETDVTNLTMFQS